MVSTFRRGLALPMRKHSTEGKPFELVPLPKQVVIPVNQHFGAPNKSLVNVGDTVVRGQKIADGIADAAALPGLMTVPVHASISGTVAKIEPRTQSNNTEGLCIVIEAASAQPGGDTAEQFMAHMDPFACTREEALARIREAGIIGMGGAGFPAHVKLSPPPGKPIDLIIANGAECEPYLTTDEAVINGKPHLLVKGLAIVMHITGVNRAIIGMEDNKKKLIPLLERELRLVDMTDKVGFGLCKTRYPQGGEKMLITALTGREVPSGGLPMDVGCIVMNVGSLIAIAEAFHLGKPLIDRDLTVSGGACKTPKNIRAPIGVSLIDMPPEFMAVDNTRLARIIYGGPMMGTAVASLEIPIQKNTSGIILMTREETCDEEEGACIRCCRCVRYCSCRLTPVLMNLRLDQDNMEEAIKAGLMDCMECGSCAYVCPARIKLVQRFRVGKQKLRMRQQAAK